MDDDDDDDLVVSVTLTERGVESVKAIALQSYSHFARE